MNQRNPNILVIDSTGHIRKYALATFGKKAITIGRNESQNDIVLSESFISDRHGVIILGREGYFYKDEKSTNGSMVSAASSTRILKNSDSPVELGNNSIIRIGSANNPNKRVLIWFVDMQGSDELIQKVIRPGELTIGRASTCDIVLNHPSVSRLHARIILSEGRFVMSDCGSANGVLINGERLTRPVQLMDKDMIQITGFQLIFSNNCIFYKKQIGGIGITARGINKIVGSGKERKQILRNVDVNIGANEFVAIIGGSGAGKSTIMNVLNGFDQEYQKGEVYYNNIDLSDNFQTLKNIIGYVPQEDIIYENLTLRRMLQYSGKLRMSNDTDQQEIERKIDEVLQTLDLKEHQNTMIRKMSGGQKKRASIAVELLADPKLLFMDEPTSGLDPGTEKNLMTSMKKLCKEQERTIVMVTHTTQSLHLCDKVIFMGPGGRVCFVGNVNEAKEFFGNDDLTEIYNIISKNAQFWERKFRQQQELDNENKAGNRNMSRYRGKKTSWLRQFITLTSRYRELTVNDSRKLIVFMLEPIIIGVLLFIVAGENIFDVYNTTLPENGETAVAVKAYNDTKSIMFTLSCAAIWIGLFNSIQEICKERSILKREYMANLRLPVYMGSKVIVQAVIGGIQAILLSLTFLFMVGQFKEDVSITRPELKTIFGDSGITLEIIFTVWITILAAMSLGLIVSSVVRTGDKAMVVAPFLLIVQLLFSGFLFELEGYSKGISMITISKWSVESLCRIANIGEIDEQFRDRLRDVEDFAWDVHDLIGDWMVLLIMALICIVISTVLLRRVAKDGR